MTLATTHGLLAALIGLAVAAPESRAQGAGDPEITHCQSTLARSLKRGKGFAEFRLTEGAEKQETKPRGKFTPRQPIDVDRIVRINGEALDKKSNGWQPVSLWCGYRGGRLVATDLVKPSERW